VGTLRSGPIGDPPAGTAGAAAANLGLAEELAMRDMKACASARASNASFRFRDQFRKALMARGSTRMSRSAPWTPFTSSLTCSSGRGDCCRYVVTISTVCGTSVEAALIVSERLMPAMSILALVARRVCQFTPTISTIRPPSVGVPLVH